MREGTAARPIRAAEHKRLSELVDKASADGYRLVGVASRELDPSETSAAGLAGARDLERDLAHPLAAVPVVAGDLDLLVVEQVVVAPA